ncbi:MAG: CIS tube protein [Sciscionella sp.]
MSLEKAALHNLETGQMVRVLFNPEEYSIKRDNNFAQTAIPGLSSPVTQFVAGNMRTLEMELFVDTYVDQAAGTDARVVADQIISLMDILPETHAPPRLEFTWGSLRFRCVLASASSTFQMFREDGTPVRMRVQVTFNEYRDPRVEAQETKRETAHYSKLRQVRQGDTISAIAAIEYNDPLGWRPIALLNEIIDPAAIIVGQTLRIPALPFRDSTGRVFT